MSIKLPLVNVHLKNEVAVTYLLASMYSTSFFLQVSLFTYITKGVDIDPVHFGYLQTVYGAVQLIGGPISGLLSDKYGVRFATRLSHLSCALSALLLFVAFDFWTLLLSRLVCIFMHGFQTGQTVLAAVTAEGQERTNAFSRMGVAFGSGFMLGPMLSALLSGRLGYKAPLLLSAGLTLLSGTIITKLIPDIDHPAAANSPSSPSSVLESLKVWKSFRVFRFAGARELFIVKGLAVTPLILITSILQLHLMERFELQPGRNSLVTMYVGLSILFMNIFGVVWLRTRFDERRLLQLGTMVLVLTYVGWSQFDHLWQLSVLIPALSLGMTVVGTVVDSRLTAIVPVGEHGVALGLSNSLNALTRTVAPLAAGFVLTQLGFSWFGYFGIVTCTIAIVIIRTLS